MLCPFVLHLTPISPTCLYTSVYRIYPAQGTTGKQWKLSLRSRLSMLE